MDSEGDLYVMDHYNYAVRKISESDKLIQTFTHAELPSQNYGDANLILNPSTSSSSGISFSYSSTDENIAIVSSVGEVSITGAGEVSITISLAGDDIYFPAKDVVLSLTIEKAQLTIFAVDGTMIQGGQIPEFNAEYSGFLNGDAASDLLIEPVLSTTSDGTELGEYVISVTGATSDNYSIAYVDGKLTVSKLTAIGDKQNDIEKEVVGVYNVLGEEIDPATSNQMMIIHYSDGSTQKIIKQ